MGGSAGGIIVQHAKTALSDPLVHGSLKERTRAVIDPILAKEPSAWSPRDKQDLAAAFTWALTNLT
jgi:hypothetical protein